MEYNFSPWWEEGVDEGISVQNKKEQSVVEQKKDDFIERKQTRSAADALRMSRREYFSLHLYQAMLSNNRAWDGVDGMWNIMARDAISAADALIEELADEDA